MYIVYVYMCKCLLNSYAILFFSFSPLLVIKYILFLFFFFFFFPIERFLDATRENPDLNTGGKFKFHIVYYSIYICISIQERKIRDKSGGKRIFSRSKILENRNGRYSIYIYLKKKKKREGQRTTKSKENIVEENEKKKRKVTHASQELKEQKKRKEKKRIKKKNERSYLNFV